MKKPFVLINISLVFLLGSCLLHQISLNDGFSCLLYFPHLGFPSQTLTSSMSPRVSSHCITCFKQSNEQIISLSRYKD